jgi:hypothetical protein
VVEAVRINADFSKAATVVPGDTAWIQSPAAGVERLMLDRIGDEVARATSLVRYAAGSSFSRHEHEKGEEFLVLAGVFSDEHADYGTGTYVRNPPGSGHTPFCKSGCRILVKLRQFDPQDLQPVVVDTNNQGLWQNTEDDGVKTLVLHEYGAESVRMFRMPSGSAMNLPSDGSEILVVSGLISCEKESWPNESWLRFPAGVVASVRAEKSSVLWLKHGHLPSADLDYSAL